MVFYRRTNSLPFASQHQGRMHAWSWFSYDYCWAVLSEPLKSNQNNLLFLFQPAEENELVVCSCIWDGAFRDWLPDQFIASMFDRSEGWNCDQYSYTLCRELAGEDPFQRKRRTAAFPHEANDALVAASYCDPVQSVVSQCHPINRAVVTLEFSSRDNQQCHHRHSLCMKLFGPDRTWVSWCKRVKTVAEGCSSLWYGSQVELKQGGYLPVEQSSLGAWTDEPLKRKTEIELIDINLLDRWRLWLSPFKSWWRYVLRYR